jgi:pSer/pThr/pTyr-binding forkhead associated (FHA) protein
MRPARPSSPEIARPPEPAPAPAPAPVPKPPEPPRAAASGSKYIVGVVAGTARGQRFRLLTTGCWLGRTKGAILFPDDVHVSPQHAAFRFRDETLFVRDESSVSGVFVSIAGQELITPGTLFAVGQRVFRFTGVVTQQPTQLGRPMPYGAPIAQGGALFGVEEVLVGGRPGRALVTPGPLITIGQAHCDLSFAGDPTLAPRHAELSLSGHGAILRDLSGGAGTFVRIGMQERPLRAGDRVRIGQQVLQIELAA